MNRSEKSVCKNCGEEIWACDEAQREWWGGKEWSHMGTGTPQCELELFAEPVADDEA